MPTDDDAATPEHRCASTPAELRPQGSRQLSCGLTLVLASLLGAVVLGTL